MDARRRLLPLRAASHSRSGVAAPTETTTKPHAPSAPRTVQCQQRSSPPRLGPTTASKACRRARPRVAGRCREPREVVSSAPGAGWSARVAHPPKATNSAADRPRATVTRTRSRRRRFAPGPSLTNELIAERRGEDHDDAAHRRHSRRWTREAIRERGPANHGGILRLDLEAEGHRPASVLTRDAAIPRLRNVVVALITGRARGLASEVALASPGRHAASLCDQPREPAHRLKDPAHRADHDTRGRPARRAVPGTECRQRLLAAPGRQIPASRLLTRKLRGRFHAATAPPSP
jgi:mRNA-degrading endonuclease toxin of MazEF toxin-antitoxin module